MGPVTAPRFALLALTMLLTLPLVLPSALGEVVDEGDRVLLPGEAVEVSVEHTGSDKGLLFYWVSVYWGSPVDVWVVPEIGWEQYHDAGSPVFEHLANGSAENVTAISGRLVKLGTPGMYYVIIVNPETNGTDEDSSIHFRVEYRPDVSFLERPVFWIIVVVIITTVVFIVAFDVLISQRRTRQELDKEKALEFEKMKGGGPREAEHRPKRPSPPPAPPSAYPKEVVRDSMRELGHDEDWEE